MCMGFPWWHIFCIYSNSPKKVKDPWNNYLDCPASSHLPATFRKPAKASRIHQQPGIILALVGLGWCAWGFPGGMFLLFIPPAPRRSKTPGIIISAAQLAAIFPQNPPEPSRTIQEASKSKQNPPTTLA